MRETQRTSIRALWALGWRSVLMLPAAVLFSVASLAAFGLLIVLLPIGVARLWAGDTLRGGWAIMGWLVLLWGCRKLRLWRAVIE
jgi:hypothetical protein